jgi:hypothetical protein
MIMSISVALILGGIAAALTGQAGPVAETPLLELARAPLPETAIDRVFTDALRARGLDTAERCSDEVFLRRVYLDVIGSLPEPSEARAFLGDQSPGKRGTLIEDLLAREEFADYWAMKWCDVLRVKSEFPINLWPNSVQAYHRWIRAALRANMPYDEFARALLTSSGSNFREPPVNFYRAVQSREPSALAAAVALTFMGARFDRWPEEREAAMAVFFSRLEYKPTAEWKEEIVCLNPSPCAPLTAILPDGTVLEIPADADPREYFAAWLLGPENEWFARNAANRIWFWLMGRGLVHEPDDFRPDNPPVHPELLAYLEGEFRSANYDLKHLYRLILNSGAYQQSAIPREVSPEAEAYFACYPVRQLDAEVLCDALSWIGGSGESYSSLIPEPYTFVPRYHRTIALADGSITSPFLEMFGRPARDTGLLSERINQPTDKQRLYLLNATDVQRKIEESPRLARMLRESRRSPDQIIRNVYLTVLSRYPAEGELASARAYAGSEGLAPRQAAADLVWALVNTKEFLYRH